MVSSINRVFTILLIIPYISIYSILFYFSLDSSPDGAQYIHMVSHPFVGREELGIHIYAYILSFFIDDGMHRIIFIQISFFLLSIYTIIKVSKNVPYKIFFLLFAIITIFSNQFGIQIRIGMAMIVFIYIYFGLKKEPSMKNILYYSLPILFHYGTLPAIGLLYLSRYMKIYSFRRLFLIFIIYSLIMLLFRNSEGIMTTIGLDPYYDDYLNPNHTLNSGRLVPFSLIAYILIILFLCIKKKSYCNGYEYFYCFTGIMLIFSVIILDLYVFYKMLNVILFFSIFYIIRDIHIKNKNNVIILSLIGYFMMYIGFIYYSTVTGII